MLSFVNNWFAQKPRPIGVDFGTDAIRLAQVQWTGEEYKLAAAATVDVPSLIRNDPAARMQFFVDSIRDLFAQGGFRGRQVCLSLPASLMNIQHIRVPKMDDAALKKAIPWEARGKMPTEPGGALIRHMVAGELYSDVDPKLEVIVMSAGKNAVGAYLAAAAKARLDVVGMHVEPRVLIDCFAQIYRRKADEDATHAFIDIGSAGTRVVVSRGAQVLFARSIPIGGNHLTDAVAQTMKISFEDAKLLRIRLAAVAPLAEVAPASETAGGRVSQLMRDVPPATVDAVEASDGEGFALLNAGLSAAGKKADYAIDPSTNPGSDDGGGVAVDSVAVANPTPAHVPAGRDDPALAERAEAKKVEQICRDPVNRLIEEIELCRRYFEGTFPSKPIERLIFVGGEARQRSICQHIARQMQLAAQVGDPLVRMARISDIGLDTGIDRRQPQPAWAVAIGLSMGNHEQSKAEG
jgi:type IV pilus assembly protein PilM